MSDHTDHTTTSAVGGHAQYFTRTIDLHLWLQEWTVTDDSSYAGTIVGLFLICMIHESLMALRAHVHQSLTLHKRTVPASCEGCCTPVRPKTLPARMSHYLQYSFPYRRLIVSILYGVNVFTSYLLMLAVMTMNVGWFWTIVCGLATGHFVFFRDLTGEAAGKGVVGEGQCGCGC